MFGIPPVNKQQKEDSYRKSIERRLTAVSAPKKPKWTSGKYKKSMNKDTGFFGGY